MGVIGRALFGGICTLSYLSMASITFIKQGPRSVRVECERVSEQDTNATYNINGLAYVETYDDVEYVTSAGVYLRQDDSGKCKAARDAYDQNKREIKNAAEEAVKAKKADNVVTTD